MSQDVLTGGMWEQRGVVLVWVRTRPDPSDRFSVAGLIACPTCHAKVDQRCSTAAGRPRPPHTTRLIARRCPCGESIPNRRKQKWCAECKVRARRAQQRRADARRRELKREYDRRRRTAA